MPSTPFVRAATVLLAAGVCAWTATALALPAALALTAGPSTLEQAVTGGCGVLLLGCAAWLVLVVTTGVLAGLLRLLPQRGRVRVATRALDRCTPAVVRGLVATLLGLAVAAGAAGPALADATGPRHPAGIAGLALPDRVVGAGPVEHAPPAPQSVVVRPGDSLWTIASRRLPRSASDARIAAAVDRLYAANRTRIGADPDLIVPGTPLVLPDLDAHHRKERP